MTDEEKKKAKEAEQKKKARKDVDALFQKSKKLKDRYSAAVATYHTINKNIQEDASWSWAAGCEQDVLGNLHREVQTFAARSSFWRDWVVMEGMHIHRKYSAEDATSELAGLAQLEELLGALERKANQFTAMRRARDE